MSNAIVKLGVFTLAMSLGFLFSTFSIERAAMAATEIDDGAEEAVGTPIGGPHGMPPGLTDFNGNKLSDGLEARLEGMSPGDEIDVVVSYVGPRGDAVSARAAIGDFTVNREFSIVNGFSATTSSQAGMQSRSC